MKINILGIEYTIIFSTEENEPRLKRLYGFADKTTHKIVISQKRDTDNVENYEDVKKDILRHEIIHAYLYESGLLDEMSHPQFGHDEQMIDWFALQAPKIFKTFQKLDLL